MLLAGLCANDEVVAQSEKPKIEIACPSFFMTAACLRDALDATKISF